MCYVRSGEVGNTRIGINWSERLNCCWFADWLCCYDITYWIIDIHVVSYWLLLYHWLVGIIRIIECWYLSSKVISQGLELNTVLRVASHPFPRCGFQVDGRRGRSRWRVTCLPFDYTLGLGRVICLYLICFCFIHVLGWVAMWFSCSWDVRLYQTCDYLILYEIIIICVYSLLFICFRCVLFVYGWRLACASGGTRGGGSSHAQRWGVTNLM